MNKKDKKIVGEELNHLFDLLNKLDYLKVLWTCDCHCGILIEYLNREMLLSLCYDENCKTYKLTCGASKKIVKTNILQRYQCLIETNNIITSMNKLYPEYRINLTLEIKPFIGLSHGWESIVHIYI